MNKKKNKFITFLLQNKFIIFLSSTVVLLRFPFLLEPIQNNQEGLYYLAARNLTTYPLKLSFPDQLSVALLRFSFIFLGNSFWSLKFSLTLLVILELVFFWILVTRLQLKRGLRIVFIILGIVYSFSFFSTNSLNYFSFFLIPLVIITTIFFFKTKFLPGSLEIPVIVVLIFLFFGSFSFFSRSKISFGYYGNFLTYISQTLGGKRGAGENYLSSFGSEVRTSYALGELLKSKTRPNEKLFVYGNYFSIYAIANRQAATNLITGFGNIDSKRLVNDLAQQNPTFILVQDNTRDLPLLDTLLKSRYNRLEQSDDVTFYQITKP